MHSTFARTQLVQAGWRSSQRTFRDRHLLQARVRRMRFCARFEASEDMGCRYTAAVLGSFLGRIRAICASVMRAVLVKTPCSRNDWCLERHGVDSTGKDEQVDADLSCSESGVIVMRRLVARDQPMFFRSSVNLLPLFHLYSPRLSILSPHFVVSVQLDCSVRHNVLPFTTFQQAPGPMPSLLGSPNRPVVWWLTHRTEFDWPRARSRPHGGRSSSSSTWGPHAREQDRVQLYYSRLDPPPRSAATLPYSSISDYSGLLTLDHRLESS
jgi:hypothetical protein